MIANHINGIKYVDFFERTHPLLLENVVLNVFSMMVALPTFHTKCVIGWKNIFQTCGPAVGIRFSDLLNLMMRTHFIISYGDTSKETFISQKYKIATTWSVASYATEIQNCKNPISCILVGALDITGQPRQLVHVWDCLVCLWARRGEHFLWRNTVVCEWDFMIRLLCCICFPFIVIKSNKLLF